MIRNHGGDGNSRVPTNGMRPGCSARLLAGLCAAWFTGLTNASPWIEVERLRLVLPQSLSSQEQASLDILQRRARTLAGHEIPHAKSGLPQTDERKVTVLLGSVTDDDALADRLGSVVGRYDQHVRRFKAREQCYLFGPYELDGRPVIVAVGMGAAGSAYAMGELAASLVRGPKGVGIEGAPLHVEGPAIAERGVYLNIASDVPPVTIHQWDEKRWSRYLDELLVARLNRLYFYLWMDVLSPQAGTSDDPEPARRLHERLQWVIPQAQRRGIRVTYLFAPTFIPRKVYQEHLSLRSKILYVDHGFPCICPTHPNAWPLMHRIYDQQIRTFRRVDGFQLWFYDPGGCMCERCRADLCAPLLRQAREFSEQVRQVNEKAEFQVSFWPIWEWERLIKRPYGNELLDRLSRDWPSDRAKPVIVDCLENPKSFLKAASDRGFVTHGFIFSTNIETSFVFLNPLLEYGQMMSDLAIQKGVRAAFCHRLEEGSKSANTFFNACRLWNSSTTREEVVGRYARWACGDLPASQCLAQGLLLWDQAVYQGVKPGDFRTVRSRVEAVQQAVPEAFRENLTPLVDSAKCLEAVADAKTVDETQSTSVPSAGRLERVMKDTVTFRAYAARGQAEYLTYVKWLKKGWQAERF